MCSDEQPRSQRLHDCDAVNRAPQSHRSCVCDEMFRSFRETVNRVANLQFWFKNLHVTVFFGSNKHRIVKIDDVLARINEYA
ncbi:hypothetical protein MtrunA17_Chr1g0158431 [Medicago truncatula]|uniref:Uncharacterized protein n=1 Tax=Medicago truncatula TaxID=3880 RepID=A0A396JM86_MEDTR|nr:hypothetical protein MtrunA17_Chr1g0158431 [Medicago truncatula]